MAIIALGVSWRQGDTPLNPGGIVTRPANYGNLGSFAKWGRRFLVGVAPYSPDPRLPGGNELAPGSWGVVAPSNPGQLDQSVANVRGVVSFTPAGPSANIATADASAAAASNQNTAATKALL